LPVLPIFIFDAEILGKLGSKNRCSGVVHWYWNWEIEDRVWKQGSSLRVFHSKLLEAFEKLIREYKIDAVYTNLDYEPYAIRRDKAVGIFLNSKGISFKPFKD
jgi:deoxyribodipyrimidine photo-lyase